jgi:hypothetical protein
MKDAGVDGLLLSKLEHLTAELTKQMNQVYQKVDALEALLLEMSLRDGIKGFYSTAEFAKKTGLKEKTVRDYCCEGKIRGEKQRGGHGRAKRWVIAHEEYLRYEREGSQQAA